MRQATIYPVTEKQAPDYGILIVVDRAHNRNDLREDDSPMCQAEEYAYHP